MIGAQETCLPEEVPARIQALLFAYNAKNLKTLEDILDFHQKFESIHPFQDGNGRIGRLVIFKECLANGISHSLLPKTLNSSTIAVSANGGTSTAT